MDSDTIFLWHGRLVQISCRCHRSHIRLSVSLMLVAGMRQLRNLRRKPNLHATGVQRGAETESMYKDRSGTRITQMTRITQINTIIVVGCESSFGPLFSSCLPSPASHLLSSHNSIVFRSPMDQQIVETLEKRLRLLYRYG